MFDMEGMEEILQDFLVEAGEILTHLDEQLVQLEGKPDDSELLNAIFRGFHTIKGGAGFLNLEPLVEICHRAENVFNVLRQGERVLNAEMMDVILFAYDAVKSMLDAVAAGQAMVPATPEFLARLDAYSEPLQEGEASPLREDPSEETQVEAASPAAIAETLEVPAAADGDEISEEEFEALLDALHGKGEVAAKTQPAETLLPPSPSKADEISEDEFEALLDELQTQKKGAVPVRAEVKPKPAEKKPDKKAVAKKAPAAPVTPAAPAPSSPVAAARKTVLGAEPVQEINFASKEETTIRVDTKRLDEVMNLVGELVLVRNRIMTLENSAEREGREAAAAHLDLVTSSLQSAVMKTRMQPIKKVFGRFPRLVRDLARNLGKEVELVLEGEDTDLDKTLVEELADPLVHLVRNAIDHGIETPSERMAAGKPATGRVLLSAQQEGDHILVTIADDGRGMDPEILKRKAMEKGVLDEESAARMDERQAFNLIFAPGFSTKESISDVSGRGVGMDVVKTHITRLNGAIDIHSRLGEGSTFLIRLPLTLAIIPTLMVGLGEQTFALPLSLVREIFNLDMGQTRVVKGQQVAIVREEVLPLVYLSQWLRLGYASQREGRSYVVVAVIGEQRIGLVVDALYGQEEVVIKSLGSMLQQVKGFAGATITGNGRVVLILDMPNLLNAYGHGR